MTAATIVFVAAFVPMLVEAARSRRNERWLRLSGAAEAEGDVYQAMQVAYPASFLAIVAEGATRNAGLDATFTVGAVLFALAKALKYWAIVVLGRRWTFRVLVLPEHPVATTGPYKYVRHPNYLGVAGELIGAAMMAHAPVTGAVALVAFGSLMLARIKIEERALGIRGGTVGNETSPH